MLNRSCLAVAISIAFLAGAAAVPGTVMAGVVDYATESTIPSDPASVNTEKRRHAQRGGRGGGRGASRGGGGRSASRGGGRRSASNRGARPSSRPSGGRPGNRPGGGPGRPGVGPGGPGRPGVGPGGPGGGVSPGRPGGGGGVNISRSTNVTVKHRSYGWRGRHWGRVVFGVTLGTAIIVAANTPPYPPDPSLCWTWNNAALTSGYWYYCEGY